MAEAVSKLLAEDVGKYALRGFENLAFISPNDDKLKRITVAMTFYASRFGKCAVAIDAKDEREAICSLFKECYLGMDYVTSVTSPRLSGEGVVGNYEDLLAFYLERKRFQACKAVIFHRFFETLLESKLAGFMDGLIARILSQRRRIRVFLTTRKADESLLKKWVNCSVLNEYGKSLSIKKRLTERINDISLLESVLVILYHAHLKPRELFGAVHKTLWWSLAEEKSDRKVEQALGKLLSLGLIERRRSEYTATLKGRELVEKLTPAKEFLETGKLRGERWIKPHYPKLPRRFRDERWIEEKIEEIVTEEGWTTLKTLWGLIAEAVKARVAEEMDRNPESYGSILSEMYSIKETDLNEAVEQFEPRAYVSDKTIYRILERFIKAGRLKKIRYAKGRGRPQFIYYKFEDKLPTYLRYRCRECAFYQKPRLRCRLFSLLDWRFKWWSPRWLPNGERPLSKTEYEKIKVAWKLNPNSDACEQLVEKKKDYVKKSTEKTCEICGSTIAKLYQKTVRCGSCGSTYKLLPTGWIGVHPSYEHVFREKYSSLAGESPEDSLKEVREARGYGQPRKERPQKERIWKDTLLLYPEDKVTVKEEALVVEHLKRAAYFPFDRVACVVDYGCLTDKQWKLLQAQGVKVVSPLEKAVVLSRLHPYPHPSFARKVEQAYEQRTAIIRKVAESNVLSMIVATRRLGEFSPYWEECWRKAVFTQLTHYMSMGRAPISRLITYEALVGIRYWEIFKMVAEVTGFKFEGRKRDRFVREFTDTPRGRARGYSPINSAINYLHQRRLYKCRVVNAETGLGWIGCEGLLHRAKRKKPIGLLLDLSDPFKLADRELLAKACLEKKLERRDFASQVGRQGMRFYYPKYETISNLEEIGILADNVSVYHNEKETPLMKAYGEYVKDFKEALETKDEEKLSPFIYANKSEREWIVKTI